MPESERFSPSDASAIRVAHVAEATKVYLEFQKLRSELVARDANGTSPKSGTTGRVTHEDSGAVLKQSREEADILRCFGAAVILQWDTLPAKLQRELYDRVGVLAETLEADHEMTRGKQFAGEPADDAEGQLDERTCVLGQR